MCFSKSLIQNARTGEIDIKIKRCASKKSGLGYTTHSILTPPCQNNITRELVCPALFSVQSQERIRSFFITKNSCASRFNAKTKSTKGANSMHEKQLTISLYDNKDKFPFTDGYFFVKPRGDFSGRLIEKMIFFRLMDICHKKDYLSNSKTFDECVHLRILLEHPTPELITVLNVCREKGVPRVTLCYSNPKSYGFILQEVAL